ncbi:MAG: ATP-binding cassette domain-containing protein [Lachnospiraceae bacterium]|nr:ATP-binding cassette domain-containing protein [Lachnospiraceae bacterium]MEE1343080.1 ATP-binding cassette domain-containing protein [Lachnospiraceae bacterium]
MLVTIENLKVQYGKQTALSITEPIVIEEGDRIGVIGSNGAGKSTLVKSILGLTSYEGVISTHLIPEQMAAHMQFNEYVSTMAVKHIMETLLNTKIKNNQKLQELISYFEFEGCLGKKYQALSGGQKQRFTIIMVMMQNAPLTFYDEVTSGLDFETRQKLMEKLVDWYKGKDNALVVVSHYYEELEQLADKILILEKGEVVDFCTQKDLFQKYCGNAIVILDNTIENRELTKEFKRLDAPNHLIAISCTDGKEEEKLISLLIEKNVNFKRSNNDIEIMSINAKKRFQEEKGGMTNE